MKSVVIIMFAVTATLTSAQARGGNTKGTIPASYDYSREKEAGYKKDYCEDSVGNHIYCSARPSGVNGNFSAVYAPKQ